MTNSFLLSNHNVAVTHDWLLDYAGAERVLEQLLQILGPKTPVYTTVYKSDNLPFLDKHEVLESFIAKLPFGRSKYRSYLPFMPLAVEQWNMNKYDVVISSSYAVAKGFLSHPDQLHISYVHSPIRYAWDLQHQYLDEANLDTGVKGIIAKWILHKMRIWDVRTAHGVDHFVANSKFIARRIYKVYRREAKVIYPPVNLEEFSFKYKKSDYYVTSGRLVPYKKQSLIIQAFNKLPQKKLIIAGDGPDMHRLKALANKNVEFTGFLDQDDLVALIQNAKAYVYAAMEDFGIAPVEAQACGTPVIALGRGGTAETVNSLESNRPTGVLYFDQVPEALSEAISVFERNQAKFDPHIIRENANLYSKEKFKREIRNYIEEKWDSFNPYAFL